MYYIEQVVENKEHQSEKAAVRLSVSKCVSQVSTVSVVPKRVLE